MDQSPELHLEEIEASDDSPGITHRHTQSKTRQTEETKWMSTAWRVLHCVLCLLTMVAVWAVALLPSVLTYTIIISPVPVMHCIHRLEYSYHLQGLKLGGNTTHLCSDEIKVGHLKKIRHIQPISHYPPHERIKTFLIKRY